MNAFAQVMISLSDYNRLKELDGRVKAVKDYVSKTTYVSGEDVCYMLGIDIDVPKVGLQCLDGLEDDGK